jgi:hypothetical protein
MKPLAVRGEYTLNLQFQYQGNKDLKDIFDLENVGDANVGVARSF